MRKFKDGQRVKYTSPDNPRMPFWFHSASMGSTGLYMWLNAKDENGRIKPITGEVHYPTGTQLDGEYWYDFFPDGWVLPESGWPRGFQAPEEHFQELGNPGEYLPGTVTGPNREPIGE